MDDKELTVTLECHDLSCSWTEDKTDALIKLVVRAVSKDEQEVRLGKKECLRFLATVLASIIETDKKNSEVEGGGL
jgi:hypothetical protein